MPLPKHATLRRLPRIRNAAGWQLWRTTGRLIQLAIVAIWASPALAHVSERAIVLLLPTEIYRTVGVAAVVLTILLTTLVPSRWLANRLPPPDIEFAIPAPAAGLGSMLGFTVFAALLATGIWGPHDPLGNLLPLTLFSVWWICLLVAASLFGNFWHWINPWAAPARIIFRDRRFIDLPARLGIRPALAGLIGYAMFYLGDLAPDSPERLSKFAGGYWLANLALIRVFGSEWLRRGECFTVLFALAGKLAPIRFRPPSLQFPGAEFNAAARIPASVGVLVVTFLAIGSFDGLNETFWWMGQIGINPLEFPGRSALVWQNRIGLFGSVIALNLIFASCVWLGLALVRSKGEFPKVFPRAAVTVLPIALAYHFSHYLPSILVSLQYWVIALNDPFDTGAMLLRMENPVVTTSFFNQYSSVRLIWLTQAGTMVVGHIIAVLLSHAMASQIFGTHRQAILSQVFVSVFMVAYTFFGLWLLASPTAL